MDQFFDDFYTPGLLAEVLKSGRVGQDNLLAKAYNKAPPPKVEIVSPKRETKVTTGKGLLKVRVRVTARGGGVGGVKLFHNGKALGGASRGIRVRDRCVNSAGRRGNRDLPSGRSEIYCFAVQLVAGKNTLRAVASSRQHIDSRPWVAELVYRPPKGVEKPDLYLFVVGINKYRNSRLNLNYGRPDAEMVSHVIQAKARPLFRRIHSYKLYDLKATRPAIERVFKPVTLQRWDCWPVHFCHRP